MEWWMSENMWEHGFLSLAYFVLHMISGSIHFPANDTISFSWWLSNIPLYNFLYPLINFKAPWLIPQFSYYEHSCNKYVMLNIW
jgi:hypothetical protein